MLHALSRERFGLHLGSLCNFFFHKLFGDMEIRSLLAAVVMFSYHIAQGIGISDLVLL